MIIYIIPLFIAVIIIHYNNIKKIKKNVSFGKNKVYIISSLKDFTKTNSYTITDYFKMWQEYEIEKYKK